MSQTKLQSAVETSVSTAVGFGISWLATLIVLPWFGHQPSVADGFGITVAFTVLSLARGYVLRRVFNHLHMVARPHPMAELRALQRRRWRDRLYRPR